MLSFAAVPFDSSLRVVCISMRLVSLMWPGLRMPRVRYVICLTSSEHPLTMRSPQQWIRDLEAKLVTQQSDLGARDSEIARLKRRIEEAERAIARKQRELTSTVKIVEYQDAKIAKLQLSIAQANEMAQHDKRNEKLRIEKLKKTRTRPTVSIQPAFCYFRSRY